jgi:hypothetical protein
MIGLDRLIKIPGVVAVGQFDNMKNFTWLRVYKKSGNLK